MVSLSALKRDSVFDKALSNSITILLCDGYVWCCPSSVYNVYATPAALWANKLFLANIIPLVQHKEILQVNFATESSYTGRGTMCSIKPSNCLTILFCDGYVCCSEGKQRLPQETQPFSSGLSLFNETSYRSLLSHQAQGVCKIKVSSHCVLFAMSPKTQGRKPLNYILPPSRFAMGFPCEFTGWGCTLQFVVEGEF